MKFGQIPVVDTRLLSLDSQNVVEITLGRIGGLVAPSSDAAPAVFVSSVYMFLQL